MSLPGTLLLAYRQAPEPVRKMVRRAVPDRLAKRIARVMRGATPKKLGTKKRKAGDVTPPAFPQYEMPLFSAFSESACELLQNFRQSPETDCDLRAFAANALGRFHLSRGRGEQAAELLNASLRIHASYAADLRQHLLLIEALRQSGREAEAYEAYLDAAARFGQSPELMLVRGNQLAGHERLKAINAALTLGKVSNLVLANPHLPPSVHNLIGDKHTTDPRSAEAKVSILVPAYNAEDYIVATVESLLAQTWNNVEILIIDDSSTDETYAKAREIAARDRRVKLLRTSTNSGAYAARNLGLQHAIGDFVTVNDADDWAHPEKIAFQATAALDSGQAFNCTSGCRVSPDLTVLVRPTDGAVALINMSSILYDRVQITRLGGWDQVRFAGDAELQERVEKDLGVKLTRLARNTPFTFILVRGDSLTQDPNTGKASINYGARREYREAYKEWHRRADDLRISHTPRSFPVPRILVEKSPETRKVDILFVSDLALRGGTNASNIAMWRAAKAGGLSTAVLHWPRLETVRRPTNENVRHHLGLGLLPAVVPGERIEAGLVIVNHPNLLKHRPSQLPDVKTNSSLVIFNQAPQTLRTGGRTVYDPSQVLRSAEQVFSCSPLVAPISGTIRQILSEYDLPFRYTSEDWTPLLNESEGIAPRTVTAGRPPKIGRHSRDDEDKWPSEKANIEAAYLADSESGVVILGGAKHAIGTLGYQPKNWNIIKFGGCPVPDFLRSIDFYVYFLREDMIEAFGRAPMEAIAAGVPTILPRSFEPTFGRAALYAEPSEVRVLVERLWNSPSEYEKQSKVGIDIINELCHPSRFMRRVNPFLAA